MCSHVPVWPDDSAAFFCVAFWQKLSFICVLENSCCSFYIDKVCKNTTETSPNRQESLFAANLSLIINLIFTHVTQQLAGYELGSLFLLKKENLVSLLVRSVHCIRATKTHKRHRRHFQPHFLLSVVSDSTVTLWFNQYSCLHWLHNPSAHSLCTKSQPEALLGSFCLLFYAHCCSDCPWWKPVLRK